MNKPYFCWNFFLIDWRHKRLKNTIDPWLFYEEHFYGFSEREKVFLSTLLLMERHNQMNLVMFIFILISHEFLHMIAALHLKFSKQNEAH